MSQRSAGSCTRCTRANASPVRPKVTVCKCVETIHWRKLFKGGIYMRKYSTYDDEATHSTLQRRSCGWASPLEKCRAQTLWAFVSLSSESCCGPLSILFVFLFQQPNSKSWANFYFWRQTYCSKMKMNDKKPNQFQLLFPGLLVLPAQRPPCGLPAASQQPPSGLPAASQPHSRMGQYFFSYLLTWEVDLIEIPEIMPQMWQYVIFLSLKPTKVTSDFILN